VGAVLRLVVDQKLSGRVGRPSIRRDSGNIRRDSGNIRRDSGNVRRDSGNIRTWHVGAVLRVVVDQKLSGRVGFPREKAGVGPKPEGTFSGTFREHSLFREHSRNIRATFGQHLGNIRATFVERWNLRGTFGEPSGNVQGTFREHLGNVKVELKRKRHHFYFIE
jgi:hypothetical protein